MILCTEVIRLKIIGLCGGSGVGKGYVGKMFSELGITVIDTDAVYHELTSHSSPCLDEIRLAFGETVINASGELDRAALSKIVFSDKERHKLLGDITYRHILSRVRSIIGELSAQGQICVIVDAPMLFESGFDKECDIILGVVASDSVRIKRIIERDGITDERAAMRISNQLSCDAIRKKCDFIIENNGDTESLKRQIVELANKFLK